MRLSRLSVLSVLFLYLFALSAPLHTAWADHESDEAYYEETYDDSEDDGSEDDECWEDDEDCDDGWSTAEWLGVAIGGVAGLTIGLPLGPVGLIGGGMVGTLLGKWIGKKLDDKSLSDRASDQWDDTKDRWDSDDFPGKYWWKDKWERHWDWWEDRWHDTEDRWDSDRFPGKYWWKETFSWGDDDEDDDDPDAPASSELSSAHEAYRQALKAYQDALKGSDTAAARKARSEFETAGKAYFAARRAAQ